MAKLAATDSESFIKTAKKNDVTTYDSYTGFNLALTERMFLQSGMLVQDTMKWNPMTYALVLNNRDLL